MGLFDFLLASAHTARCDGRAALPTGISSLGILPEPEDKKSESRPLLDTTRKLVPNPVQFENFSKEWMQASGQDNFDGFRLEAMKPVNKYLQMGHSLFLGSQMFPEGYMYQVGPMLTSGDGQNVITARWTMGAGGIFLRSVSKLDAYNAEARCTLQSSLKDPNRNMFEGALDKAGEDWAVSFKSVYQGTWISTVGYSQEITDNISLGGDFTLVAANAATFASIGSRWVNGPNYVSLLLSRQPDFKRGPLNSVNALKAQYLRKVSDRLSVGTEIELDDDMQSSLKLAYDYMFKVGRVQGLADSSGKISCSVQDGHGFGISGQVNFIQGDYKFGFMMQFTPPSEEGQN